MRDGLSEQAWLAERFEQHRTRLRSVAYRMLGSISDAEDAVQDAWLRVSNADTGDVDDLAAWLTTVTARVCLNMLRTRRTRGEQSLEGRLPDPILSDPHPGPEDQVVMSDSISLALLIVLDTLSPAERLSFVLHDMFAVPFEEIAIMLDKSPEATRQLASRARRRVQGGEAPAPHRDIVREREIVDAFFAAARNGDFETLVAVLHPDVVLYPDFGAARRGPIREVRGAADVASQAVRFAHPATALSPVLVNGTVGVVVSIEEKPLSIMGFTIVDGRIMAIHAIADPARVRSLVEADA